MSLRIVATADNHLGRHVARLAPRILEERRQRLRRAFGRTIDAAIDREAHLVVLAGDLFDTPAPRNPERIFVAHQLSRLRRHGILAVAVGGNHDAPRSSTEEGGSLALRVYSELDALEFFGCPGDDFVVRPRVTRLGGMDVAIGGFTPRLTLTSADDPLDGVCVDGPPADVRILVTHGMVEGTAPYGAQEPIIGRETIARLSGAVDLLIIGDIHSPATFHCGEVAVVVPGATEHLAFDEAFTPGFAWIRASRQGATMEHVPLDPQRRLNVRVATEGLDASDPTGDLIGRIDACADSDAIARLTVEGALPRDVYRRVNTAAIEEYGRGAFFSFDLDLARLLVRLQLDGGGEWAPRRTMSEEVRGVIASQRRALDHGSDATLLDDVEREILGALVEDGEGVAE